MAQSTMIITVAVSSIELGFMLTGMGQDWQKAEEDIAVTYLDWAKANSSALRQELAATAIAYKGVVPYFAEAGFVIAISSSV